MPNHLPKDGSEKSLLLLRDVTDGLPSHAKHFILVARLEAEELGDLFLLTNVDLSLCR